MSLTILFFTGLIAGFAVSQIQKTDIQGPIVDIIFGIMGAMLVGGMVAQFTNLYFIVMLMAVVGAVLFVELERIVPEP